MTDKIYSREGQYFESGDRVRDGIISVYYEIRVLEDFKFEGGPVVESVPVFAWIIPKSGAASANSFSSWEEAEADIRTKLGG